MTDPAIFCVEGRLLTTKELGKLVVATLPEIGCVAGRLLTEKLLGKFVVATLPETTVDDGKLTTATDDDDPLLDCPIT